LTSGICNVAIGPSALGAATTGCLNIAIGDLAMGGAVVTGINNVAIGSNPMKLATSASHNIAISSFVQCGITSGTHNIGVGYNSQGGCTLTGHYNVALGRDTLHVLTSGGCNVAVGYQAGRSINTGGNNTLIGAHAGCNSEFTLTSQNHHIQIGDNNATNFSVSVGLTNPSDARDKTDVADLDLGLDYIKALRPVYYRWDKRSYYDDSGDSYGTAEELETYLAYEPDGSSKRNRWEIGLLAQEVLAAEKLHTSNTQVLNEGMDTVANEGLTVEGTLETGYQLQYQKITMPLIKAAKELDAKIVALTARVADLE